MGMMSIDGLASGLDTTSLISQLMRVESIPQTQLKNRLTQTNQAVSALQTINTKATSLAAAAKALTEAKAWQPAKATSSDSSVTVTATPGAPATTATFSVKNLAVAHSVLSEPLTWTEASSTSPGPVLTITRDGVTSAPIEPTSNDPREIAKAINGAKAGVNAVAVLTAPDTYELKLTSTTTGAKSAFTVDGLTTSVFTQGDDARISYGTSTTTGAELIATSGTNTFAELFPGVSVTASKVVSGVTIGVTTDTAAISSQVGGLVTSINNVLSDIRYQSTPAPKGSSVGGALVGSSAIRSLGQSLQTAATGMVGTHVAASSGIEIQRDGTLKFDQEKFGKLLAERPDEAQAIVAGLAARVQGVAEAASKSDTGSLTLLITSQQGLAKGFTTQIESWDRRLALRESSLKATFSALEVALSGMQSQSQWLAGQLAGLPSYNSNR